MSTSYSGSFLGIVPFGLNVFTGPTPLVPTDVTYDTLTIYGPAYFDKIHIQNTEVTQAIIDAYTLDLYAPAWGGNTIFLANFDDSNLNAGNVLTSSGNPIVGWMVSRREQGGSLSITVCHPDVNTTGCIDPTVELGKTYIYDVRPYTDYEVGDVLESAPVTVDYYGYFLIDPTTGDAYKFDLNVVSGPMTNDSSMTEYETFTERNAYSFVDKDIMRCTISAVVGEDEDGELSQTVDLLDELKTFIKNGEEKIFKTRKGQVFRGITTNYQQSQINDDIEAQLYNISFDFIETSDLLGDG
jgi:hypothetical protein